MRIAFGAMVLCWIATSALATEPELETGQRSYPADDAVIDLVGSAMPKVFSTFGAPEDLTVADASTSTPSVCFDYGPYGYIVRDKFVHSCIFWSEWKEPVLGIKLGDKADDIIATLGKPKTLTKDDKGLEHMTWPIKENGLMLLLDFDKDRKLSRAVVGMK
jgi:hypothetical protein